MRDLLHGPSFSARDARLQGFLAALPRSGRACQERGRLPGRLRATRHRGEQQRGQVHRPSRACLGVSPNASGARHIQTRRRPHPIANARLTAAARSALRSSVARPSGEKSSRHPQRSGAPRFVAKGNARRAALTAAPSRCAQGPRHRRRVLRAAAARLSKPCAVRGRCCFASQSSCEDPAPARRAASHMQCPAGAVVWLAPRRRRCSSKAGACDNQLARSPAVLIRLSNSRAIGSPTLGAQPVRELWASWSYYA